MSSLMDYDLELRIVRYKQWRNVAIVVLLIGSALAIAGAVMLGIGISKKHDADNAVCTTKTPRSCPPVPPCQTTPFLTGSSTTNQATRTTAASSSPTLATSIASSGTTTAGGTSASSPITTSVTVSSSTSGSLPTISTTFHSTHTVPILTTAVVPDPSTTATNTPPNYPADGSYNPCKSYIIIAFEAASRVPDDVFQAQKNFILQYLIKQNWTNPERMAFVAFAETKVQKQGFHQFKTLAEFVTAISQVEKFQDPFQGYTALFPALLDLVRDAEHEYVNTVIFTSYTDGDEIHGQYASARQMDTNGRLIIVTTKDGITTDYYPWTNNKANQVIYLNAGPFGLQANKIIQTFRCPTLPTVPALTTAVVPDPSTTTKTPTTTNTPPDYPIDKSYNPCKSYIIIAFEAASRVSDDIFETQKNFITQNLIQSNWTNPERMAFVAFSKSHIQQQRFHHYHDLASFQNDIKNTGKFGDPSQGYASVFPALLDLVHDAEHEYVNTIIFTSYTDGDEIHEQYASARQMDTNGRLIIVTTKDGITTDFYPWTNNKADQVIYLNAGPVGLQATKIIQEFRCPTLNP